MRTELQHRVVQSPAACILLISRAKLSAEKAGRDLSAVLPGFLKQGAKMYDALDSVTGKSLRDVVSIMRDERENFLSARLREPDRRAQEETLAAFVRDVSAVAESVIPGITVDRCQP